MKDSVPEPAQPKMLHAGNAKKAVPLSGRQRQRLAIARVFLKNARILLLNEASCALQTKSERAEQTAVDAIDDWPRDHLHRALGFDDSRR
jgi:ABC-type transport system involved in Fe-S cluster assembly fused permease/ATPase subunit